MTTPCSDGAASRRANMVQPALPRLPGGGVQLPRLRNLTSPVHPSPLRESSLAESMEGMKLSTTPEGTTPAAMTKTSENIEAKKRELTPPASKRNEPLVVDGSRERHLATVETPVATVPQDDIVTRQSPEDPFLASPPVAPTTTVANPAGMPLAQAIARIQANLTLPRDPEGFSPRFDRLNEPVTAANAQAVLPAAAALFVANLSNSRTDDQLEVSVLSKLDVYGRCYVKIRRDKQGQPYAVVQFETVADAELALLHSNGEFIDDRPCRIEKARAAREVIVSRVGGGTLTACDVVQALTPYGALAEMSQTGGRCTDIHQAEAYIAKFAYFQDSRDALAAYKNHATLRVAPAPKDRPVRIFAPIGTPSTPGHGQHSNNDSRSIFVGNLPETATEGMLREMFANFGTVESVDVISKPITTMPGAMNTFAFVEFAYAGDADMAANSQAVIEGRGLRIERKMYSARRAARIASERSHYWPSHATPRMRAPNNTPTSLTGIYNHAVNMGVAPYQAANMYSHTGMQPRYSPQPAPMPVDMQFPQYQGYTSPYQARARFNPQQTHMFYNSPYSQAMQSIAETEEDAVYEN